MEDMNVVITKELAKLAELEVFAINSLRGGLRVMDNGALIEFGNAKAFCDVMLKIIKRRSALLGLDQTEKIALTDRPVSELSDQELERIINMAQNG
jgi:hypothetical protein